MRRSFSLSIVRALIVGRYRATEAHQHRNEGAARKPEPSEQLIHDERRARKITAVLQQRQAQKQDGDLREEGEHASHAADDAVADQADQPLRGCRCPLAFARSRGARISPMNISTWSDSHAPTVPNVSVNIPSMMSRNRGMAKYLWGKDGRRFYLTDPFRPACAYA